MIIIADIYERSELRVTSAGLCGCVYRTVLYISETTVYNIKGEGDAHIISIGDYSILVEGIPPSKHHLIFAAVRGWSYTTGL